MTDAIASQAPLLPTQREQELSWDEELADEELLREKQEIQDDPPKGLRPSLRFFCTMATVGVVLALGWRYTGIAEQVDRLWTSSVASDQGAAPMVAKAADEPLTPILTELNGLKTEVARLSAANQQMAGTIASLQAQQRELQQRLTSASAATHLFSDPKLLEFNIVPGKRSLVTGSTAHPPTTNGARPTASAAPVRGETRRLPAPRPGNAPLALVPPN